MRISFFDALSEEAVAKETGGALGQFPIIAGGPERRQFFFREAGTDADFGVVTRDAVAADEAEQRCGDEREIGALRFAREKRVGLLGCAREKFSEVGLEKMVEEEAGDDYVARFGVGAIEPLEDVHRDWFDLPFSRGEGLLGFRGEQLLAVNEDGANRRRAR